VSHKWIVTCMSLTLCAPAGVLALHGLHPWHSLEMPAPSRTARSFIRIELPEVKVVEAAQATDLDASVILREAAASTESQADAEPDQGLELAMGQAGQARDPERNVPARSPQARQPEGLLEVSFNLAEAGAMDRSSLDVRKGVRFNGADAGQATIRVGAGSALYIASEDLRTLLSAAKRVDLVESLAAGAQQPFVGFDEVRQKGLNLRYDAVSDRILISG
jgi:hypothetical protein